MAGIDVAHVPYKGTPEAIGDTIAGRVCCYWAPINAALPHVNGGKAVRARGLVAQRSSLLLPNVPSVAEQGVPGLRLHALGRPVGTGDDASRTRHKINKDVNAALASPDLASG